MFLSETPLGFSGTFLEGGYFSNAHLPSTEENVALNQRATGRLSVEKLVEIWSKRRSKDVESGNALMWSDIEDKIVVARVKCAVFPSGFKLHTLAFMDGYSLWSKCAVVGL